jgi:hypothetical protein
MSARRRDRNPSSGGAGNPGRGRRGRQRTPAEGGGTPNPTQGGRARGQGGRDATEARSSASGRKRGQPNARARGRKQGRPRDDAAFWGDAAQLPVAERGVQITDDPAAVPRSLGHPPLPGHEVIAEHYFTAVYDRAVTTAGALAAAGGLIDPDELVEELAS